MSQWVSDKVTYWAVLDSWKGNFELELKMCFFRGTVLANKVGRRWTHSSLLGINALLFGAVMVMVPYQVWCERELMISTYFLFYPKHTDAGVSTVIQVLCMIVKMNISATFIVAYMQAIKSSSSIFAKKTYICHIRCSCFLPYPESVVPLAMFFITSAFPLRRWRFSQRQFDNLGSDS